MNLLEFATWLQSTPFSVAIQSSSWLVPALQSVHIVMIGVVFVSIVMIALRVLGLVRADEDLPTVWRRFAPFLWCGLAALALTGLLLTVAEPVREFMTFSFRAKLVLLVVAIASAAAFGNRVRAGAAVSGALRAGAAATVALWLCILFLGRAIAYDDVVWGAWSPVTVQAVQP